MHKLARRRSGGLKNDNLLFYETHDVGGRWMEDLQAHWSKRIRIVGRNMQL